MSVFFEKIMPNVVAYWDRFTTSCGQTLQMFAIAGVFTFIFGLIFGDTHGYKARWDKTESCHLLYC